MKFKKLTQEHKGLFMEIWDSKDMSRPDKVNLLSEQFDIKSRSVYYWAGKIEDEIKEALEGEEINASDNCFGFDVNNESYGGSDEDQMIQDCIDDEVPNMKEFEDKLKKEAEEEKYNIIHPDKKTIHKQTEEIKRLKKALKEAKHEVNVSSDIKQLIYDLKDVDMVDKEMPEWVKSPSNSNELTPVFCLSDIHIGSTINPADVNGVNEYSVDIAKERIFGLVDDFIDMYINKMSYYQYKGCVLIFGGDMVENAMHFTEETNELTTVDQVIEATSILIEVVSRLEKAFTKVFIPAVSGNHGRLDTKNWTRNTERLNHSLEKIVYHFVSLHFNDNDNVALVMNLSDILHFSINGLRFRLEHGDSIKFTGQAISGPLNSFERARLKRSSVDSATGNDFDVLIFGHFHQHLMGAGNKLICMDSTKGYDTYVMRMALPYNLPGCTTFSVNTKGEIIYATNLKCRSEDTKNSYNKSRPSIEIF